MIFISSARALCFRAQWPFTHSIEGGSELEQTPMNLRKYAELPGNVRLRKGEAGLPRASVVNVTQIATVDRDLMGPPMLEQLSQFPHSILQRLLLLPERSAELLFTGEGDLHLGQGRIGQIALLAEGFQGSRGLGGLLLQSGIAALSQANQSSQSILSLLR